MIFVTPLEGRSGIDLFTITISSFEDPENDIPLQYSIEMISNAETNAIGTLTDFQPSTIISTTLPLPKIEGTNITLIAVAVAVAVARDSLGAESTRSIRTSAVRVTTAFDPDNLFELNDILTEQRNLGASDEDLLRIC